MWAEDGVYRGVKSTKFVSARAIVGITNYSKRGQKGTFRYSLGTVWVHLGTVQVHFGTFRVLRWAVFACLIAPARFLHSAGCEFLAKNVKKQGKNARFGQNSAEFTRF